MPSILRHLMKLIDTGRQPDDHPQHLVKMLGQKKGGHAKTQQRYLKTLGNLKTERASVIQAGFLHAAQDSPGAIQKDHKKEQTPVSYTHLTLPTN